MNKEFEKKGMKRFRIRFVEKKSVGGNLKSLMQDLFINNAIKPPFTNILYHPSAVLIQNCLTKTVRSQNVCSHSWYSWFFKLWLIWPHRMNYLASFGRWLHQCSGSCFLKLPHGVVQQLGYSNVDFHLTAQLRLVYKRTKSRKNK